MIISDCLSDLHPLVILCDFLAIIFALLSSIRAVFQLVQFYETSQFYKSVLGKFLSAIRPFYLPDNFIYQMLFDEMRFFKMLLALGNAAL